MEAAWRAGVCGFFRAEPRYSFSMHPTRTLFAAGSVLLLAFSLPAIRAAEPAQKTVTPGENLVVDGIPPIPADIVDRVGRYTEARAAVFADWHPTKPEMLIGTRFGETAQLHQVR